MYRKPFLILCLGLSLQTWLYAQKQGQERVDSLQAVFPHLTSDTARVKGLAEISFAWFPINPNTGLKYGEKSLQMAVRLKYPEGEALASNALGANYWARHEFLKAQDYYLQALKLNTKLNNKREMARNTHNIADVYAEFDTEKSLLYYHKALAMVSALGDQVAILGFQANIADIYERQKKYPEAAIYLQKSIKLAKSLHRERDVAAYQSLLSVIQCQMNDYRQAIRSADSALRIFKKIAPQNPRKDDIARTLLNIATIYDQNKDFNQSLRYNKAADQAFERLGGGVDMAYAAECLTNIGRIHLDRARRQKDHPPAADLIAASTALKRAVEIAGKIKQWRTLTVSLKDLSAVQKLSGEQSEALQSLEQYAIYKDSLYNADMNRNIALRQMDFEYTQEKDSLNNLNKLQAGQIKLLDQQRTLEKLKVRQQWLIFLIVFITLCLVAFYFLYRFRLTRLQLNNDLAKEKMAKELQTAEYKKNINQNTLATLISQMNPHFIFNALNTIQSFIYSNEKKLASEYLGKFADLTRKILDNSRKQLISLEEELLLLNLYLDIEKARFGEELKVSIQLSDQVDPTDFFLPPMLIQPFVENAIKHGLMHSKNQKELNIKINPGTEKKDGIEISIEDNGIGRAQSMALNEHRKGHQSFANDANEKRIDIINYQLSGPKIELEIIDKKNEAGIATGTSVVLQVPNTLNSNHV